MKFSIYKKCCNTNWPVITDVSSFCAHREQASYSKQQCRIFWKKKKKTLGNRTRFIWMELKMTRPKHVGGESRPRCTCIYIKPYVLELSSNTLQPTWPHMNWVKYMHIYPKKSWLVRLEMRAYIISIVRSIIRPAIYLRARSIRIRIRSLGSSIGCGLDHAEQDMRLQPYRCVRSHWVRRGPNEYLCRTVFCKSHRRRA